jgi:hypothetical protein
VSRTPIREALSELVTTGLVKIAANRYTRVVTPQPEDVLDAIQTPLLKSLKLAVGKTAITGQNMYTNEAIAAITPRPAPTPDAL